jgi:hypothetical protein
MSEPFGAPKRQIGGSRNNPNRAFESTMRQAGVSYRRERESTRGVPLGDPRSADVYRHLSDRRLTGTRMSRTASSTGTGSTIQMATSRPRDPMWNWKQNNLPINFTEPEELKRVREFCNTPDAPVMMADGTSKPMGTVEPGDQVMGWTYIELWNGGLRRKYVTSTVLAVGTRTADDVVQLNMASGAAVKCTSDHKWHNPHFTKPQTVPGPWPPDYTAAVRKQSVEYEAASVGSELLAPTNIRTIWNPGNLFSSSYPGDITVSDASIDKVIGIDEIGRADVVSLQTETGNYIAWGYCSKNCRLLYATHPIVSACIDVYSKLPMQGLHFECKDPQLVDFYSELFLDQLDYEEHLLKLGRQYWLAGESWTLGGWNETLGIWEEEQLINPDDVEVEKSLFLKEPRYLMRLPESLRKILTTRQPFWQYNQLVQQFPELVAYASQDSLIPVSNIVLKQMRFEADDFSNRGIPILMRAMRTLIQEEMLNSALDSIAERLYTPLILTKLGASASDLGTNGIPWIPSQDDMDEFNAALDAALAADFRALTYHWAVDMQPVFGRENVPDLSNDFDRIVERILMVFGLSQTMLTGASAGETYAADALNRDVVTQLLSHYQRMQANFVYDRAAIVAEAQGHFDYEVRNGMRYLVTEEIYEIDEETNEGRIVEIPKLLVPELKYKVLNLSDEEQERQFVETLAEAAVPVPYRARMQAAGIDFEEALEQRSQEAVDLAVQEQQTRKKTYLALKRENLPIPDDLRQDFDPKAQQPGGAAPQMPGLDQPLPGMTPEELPALAPTPDELMGEDDATDQDASDAAQGIPFGADQDPNEDQDVDEDGNPKNRPEESDEEREDMPKKTSALRREAALHNAAVQRFGRHEILLATKEHYDQPDNSKEDPDRPQDWQPTGRFGTPKHAGMVRHVHIPAQFRVPSEEQDED